MLTLLFGAAVAGTTAIDVAGARSLGMPRLHEPFEDCECVAMTWDSARGPLTLEVPLDDISRIEHTTGDGPHEVALVVSDGTRLPLEEAPCVFAEQASAKYQTVLGIDVQVVGDRAADGSTCGDAFEDLRQWSEEVNRLQRSSVHYISNDDLQLASLTVVSSKGNDGEVATVKRTLAASRSRAARCWADAEDAGSVVMVSKGGALKARRSGDAGVDACMSELAASTTMPAGTAKVKVVFGPPNG